MSFLNLCRLFSHIGYAARHFKETHLTIHNRPGDGTLLEVGTDQGVKHCDVARGTWSGVLAAREANSSSTAWWAVGFSGSQLPCLLLLFAFKWYFV